MSADARSVFVAVDGFRALLGLALLPLFPSFDFLFGARCSRLPGCSVLKFARSVGGRECSVGRWSRLPGCSAFVEFPATYRGGEVQ